MEQIPDGGYNLIIFAIIAITMLVVLKWPKKK